MPELPLVVWIRSCGGGGRLGGMPAGGIYLSLVYTYGRSIPLGGVSSELHILGIFVPQNEGCFVPISQDRYLHL